MIRIYLTEEEKTALNRLRREQKSNVGERAHYVLLCAVGKSASEIATHLSRNAHTIRLWLKRYQKEGLAGLKSKKQPGRPAKKHRLLNLKFKSC